MPCEASGTEPRHRVRQQAEAHNIRVVRMLVREDTDGVARGP